jgi:hypothetical protein
MLNKWSTGYMQAMPESYCHITAVVHQEDVGFCL